MSLTPSNMLALGTRAPDFSLPATDGTVVSRQDFVGKPLLVMFICNHCPYVKHVAGELARIGREYAGRVAMVAISSNDADAYPEDGPDMMKKEVSDRGYSFPYLFDESQEVARSYAAACTPDIYVFDSAHSLVYRGQIDASRPGGATPVTGRDLRAALDAVLSARPVNGEQRPSVGCNIKWRRR